MNRELRRFALVALPASIVVLLAAIVVTVVLDDDAPQGPPSAGNHWHARYVYIVCDEVQQNAPFWESGVHTHGDGIIHIHPFQASEEGRGARLVKWFEYGGGVLTDDEVRLPGDATTYHNGDSCPDGPEGTVQVFVTPASTGVGEELDEWSDYIPQDGDLVVIYFGPEIAE